MTKFIRPDAEAILHVVDCRREHVIDRGSIRGLATTALQVAVASDVSGVYQSIIVALHLRTSHVHMWSGIHPSKACKQNCHYRETVRSLRIRLRPMAYISFRAALTK